jgi:alpha-beta hydrolase superfamily lysophospholipase
MKHINYQIHSSENLKLFGRAWLSEKPDPKGVVNLIHGLGEHSGRYHHIGDALNEAGYHLAAIDLRGHGLSDGKRGDIPSFERVLDDVGLFLQDSQRRFGNLQTHFLYGHSLGANIVVNFGLRRSAELAGIIATSPSFRLAFDPPKLTLFMGKILAKISPSFTMNNNLELDALSRDQAIVQAYKDDVYVHNRISAKLAMSLFESGQYALDHAHEFTLPLLLMHGTEDRIGSSKATQEFADKAYENVELVLWEGYYHETHNDIGKEKVIAKLIAWIDEQTVAYQ